MFKNPLDDYTMMVLNEKGGEYYNIPYHNIEFEFRDYLFNDGWIVPSNFVFVVDDNGKFTYICPNLDNIFGYSVAEVTEMGTISKLFGSHLFDSDELASKGEMRTNLCTPISDLR